MSYTEQVKKYLDNFVEDKGLIGLHLNSNDKEAFVVAMIDRIEDPECMGLLLDSNANFDGMLFASIGAVHRVTHHSNYLDLLSHACNSKLSELGIDVLDKYKDCHGLIDAMIVASNLEELVDVRFFDRQSCMCSVYGVTADYVDIISVDEAGRETERVLYNIDDISAVTVGSPMLSVLKRLYDQHLVQEPKPD